MLTRLLRRVAPRSPDTGTLLQEAFALVNAGRTDAALTRLEKVLATHPGHPDALYIMGLACAEAGDQPSALSWYAQAREADRTNAAYAFSAGMSHRALEDLDAAIAAWRDADSLDPGDAGTLDQLGMALLEAGDIDEAVRVLTRAIEASPDDGIVLFHLGNAQRSAGDEAAAAGAFERATMLRPNDERAHNNLGVALHALGLFDPARLAFERACALAPEYADARNNLGSALQGLERPEEAIAHFEHALALDPSHAHAGRNRAQALQEIGRWREARDAFAAAGGAGGPRFRHALVLPVIPASAAEIVEARERIGPALDALAADGVVLHQPDVEVGTANFHLAYHGLSNRELQSRIARAYLDACPSLAWTAEHVGRARRGGRLRIGFLSRFLRRHSIGKTSRGLIERLSRREFEVICLHVPPVSDDDMALAIRASADRNVVLPLRLEAARAAIAELELDALFYQDIGIDPFTYYLAFARLAPVQCVSFGHPDTTGIPNMDWFVSSELFEPDDGDAHYSERLWRARDAGTLAYYYRPKEVAADVSRRDLGLPEDKPLYFCPHTHFRLHPDFDVLLRGILETDSRGEIILVESRQASWTRLLMDRLARSLGPHFARIRTVRLQPHATYLALMRLTDAMLDPIHFNGMNNSLDAFAAGVPVVTWPRSLQRGRHTAGMYRRMEWTDCVARDAEDWVRLAVRLGTDPDFRHAARAEVGARASVLFEDPVVVREFERFFLEQCRR